jgi:hypothetical protein
MGKCRRILQRCAMRMRQAGSDVGMSTAEYALGTVAAVALATVLCEAVELVSS